MMDVVKQLTANSKAVERLCNLLITPNVDILVAGPESKKANPAPGETPPIKNTATNGVALEAQT
ncbi:MAG: DNA-binding FrmR family transcriptional regulator [Phenylobacterium sp.]|jgi:DNA-binding FrmR family transcriptional regulator